MAPAAPPGKPRCSVSELMRKPTGPAPGGAGGSPRQAQVQREPRAAGELGPVSSHHHGFYYNVTPEAPGPKTSSKTLFFQKRRKQPHMGCGGRSGAGLTVLGGARGVRVGDAPRPQARDACSQRSLPTAKEQGCTCSPIQKRIFGRVFLPAFISCTVQDGQGQAVFLTLLPTVPNPSGVCS